MSRNALEQLKHFLTKDDPQADLYGAGALVNLIDTSAASIVTAVDGISVGGVGNETTYSEAVLTNTQLATIYTELDTIQSEAYASFVSSAAIQTDIRIVRTEIEGTVVDALTDSLAELEGINTDTSNLAVINQTLQTDVRTDLKRGRTNFGGKLSTKILSTSSGSASTSMGTTNGARIRHIIVATEDSPGSDTHFRFTFGGVVIFQLWFQRNGYTTDYVINLDQFYLSSAASSGNPTFTIGRLTGVAECEINILYEDLAEDNSAYPTS